MDQILNFDGKFLVWIQDALQNPILDKFFISITHMGDLGIVWIALGIILLCFKRTRKTGLILCLSLLTTHILNTLVIKNIIMRPRPYETLQNVVNLIGPQSQSSFPSGHASSSFAAATVPFLRERGLLKWLPIFLAALIAFSRVYVGVHYPIDVITGSLIGILIAGFMCFVFKKKRFRR